MDDDGEIDPEINEALFVGAVIMKPLVLSTFEVYAAAMPLLITHLTPDIPPYAFLAGLVYVRGLWFNN